MGATMGFLVFSYKVALLTASGLDERVGNSVKKRQNIKNLLEGNKMKKNY